MDSDIFSPPVDFVKCGNCGFSFSLAAGSSGSLIPTFKRKLEGFEDGDGSDAPGSELYSNARILVENECLALREALSNQQQTIQDLHSELEEERNAASSAANEAMSMILRLQSEKAEIIMEARQFKLFAEERMAHDQEELLVLEGLLYKREQNIQALTCELQAYKHRMMSYGLIEEDAEGEKIGFSQNSSMVDIDTQFDPSSIDYPPLTCNVYENLEDHFDVADVEKYPCLESPCEREHLKSLEQRIGQLERNPSYTQVDGDFSGDKNVVEKSIVGQSPRRPKHYSKLSLSSVGPRSPLGTARETKPAFLMESPKSTSSFKKECVNIDNASEIRDDMSDRVYTIDFIHDGVPQNGFDEAKKGGAEFCDLYPNSPRCQEMLMNQHEDHKADVKNLYMRLQALEADKESLRQTILSMRTDKAQLVLLKEIAQHLSKEIGPVKRMPVRKLSFLGAFSISLCKLIVSFVFWKKKAHRRRYVYGLSTNNMGLLMLLDTGLRARQWRCLTSAQDFSCQLQSRDT